MYDIDEARADLISRGVKVSETFHDATGVFHHAGAEGRLDGNGWVLQEIKTRLPGR